MRTAALAGVDVRLMLPKKGDSKMMDWASISYVMETLQAGVKVYLYEGGFNHSKLLVSDASVSTCGSTNVDFRSFEHNFESNIFFYDEGMALRLKAVFLADQKQCHLIDEVQKVEDRPFLRRFAESVLRIVSPLM
jgi:cardiolipin synthase